MGWLPGAKGSLPAHVGSAGLGGGFHPATQTHQPAVRGIKPTACGIEPKRLRTTPQPRTENNELGTAPP